MANVVTSPEMRSQRLNLQNLNNQKIEFGHFDSSGVHTSGELITDILKQYAFGLMTGQPARDIKGAALVKNAMFLNDPRVKRIKKMLSGELGSIPSVPDILDELGEAFVDIYKGMFGKVGILMPPDKDGTPLLETGEIRDATSYRTSKNRTVRS